VNFILKIREKIFEQGLFGQAHASSLLRLADGRYLAAWFAGTKEGALDVSIYGSIRNREGKWSTPIRWGRVREAPHWNPVLFQVPNGAVKLFFKVGNDCANWETWVCQSNDEGLSWDKPCELVPGNKGGRGPVKNKPIILSDSSWLAPASLEDKNKWRVFADRSRDAGIHWEASKEVPMNRKLINGQGVIQPSLWESLPGHVHMLVRSSCSFICRSDSNDYGATWSELELTKLPNNNSGIDLDKAPDGTLLLAYNRVSKDWGPRTPLNLAVSQDNGSSWEDLCELETAPGEYSYPAVRVTPEGFAGTYTWKRDSIAFWEAKFNA